MAIDKDRTYVARGQGSTTTLYAFAGDGLGRDYRVALQATLTAVAPTPDNGSSGAVPTPKPPPAGGGSSQRQSYVIIDSRGSGETHTANGKRVVSISPPGAAFVLAFIRRHRFAKVGIESNPYPAVGLGLFDVREFLNLIGAGFRIRKLGAYHDSVVDGKEWLARRIRSEVNNHPDAQILLTGYSQGAQVTADVYQKLAHNDRRIARNIRGVVLFGDPYFNHSDKAADRGNYDRRRHGVLGVRGPFSRGITLSYCHRYDPVCQSPLNPRTILLHGFKAHENYPPDAKAAAAFLN